MTDIVLSESMWTAGAAHPRRSKARAEAYAAQLPAGGSLVLSAGGVTLRTITVGAWSVGAVQSDGRYPLIPGPFTDPETGAGTPDTAIFKDAGGVEKMRMSAGVGSGTFRLMNALEAGTPITRGAFVVLYASDDIPVPPVDPPVDPPIADWVDTLVSDMALFHDGPCRTLQYIPTWGSGWGMPAWYPKPSGWTTVGAWGVIMEDYSGAGTPSQGWRVSGPYTGNQAPNTRAQVRDIQFWWLLSNGTWVLGRHNHVPGGYMYLSSWAGETYTAQNAIRTEPDSNGGGRSCQYINMNGPGYPFKDWHWHFFGSRMDAPANYVGFASAFFARKILDNPAGADDRAAARLLVDVAGDWWITPTAQWNGNGVNNRPTGYNRFKYLTNDWQLIAHHSLSSAQIRANPPPLIGL